MPLTDRDLENIQVQLHERMQDLREAAHFQEPVHRQLFMESRLAGVSAWLYSVLPQYEVQLEVTPTERSFDYSVRFRPRRF